ncbi:carboxypeptidase-like regulatory domain-containing protein [Flavobacterium branchiarum]|uniref:Carboxypeptidase-like regulatory domain-containing protein n=2 Tax=Flavobacterium branchiarum TaxID=1114870 RepID=A0ABV5FQD0_9FLAO|nr:carboxypeptidase-like regulatory domain-containing protein [Flavobacterium branchiarum]MDN3673258.1 carboxypeptidase-like regulatory domain-containing protein [Flavobacterium branchiarum]
MYRIIIVVLLNINFLYGQETKISAQILDKNNNKIKFANIGIKDKDLGTISDENGLFSIYIPEKNLGDTLTISYVGYNEFKIKITDVIANKISQFVLEESINELSEVVILSDKIKEVAIGTKSYSSMVAGYVRVNNDKNKDIQEFAKEININKPIKIKSLSVNLFNVKVKTAKFRINFYSIKNNLPFENINQQNIILTHDIETGWNKFDISDYDVKLAKSFFISLEYIPDNDNTDEPFRYSGQLFGRSITRTSSLGNWKTKKGLSISIYLTANQSVGNISN